MSNPILNSFLKWEKEKPDFIFLRQPVNGKWHEWTFKQAGDEIRKMASGLLSLNLPEKSNVALLSKNCAHWIMADLSIMMTGHVSVPLYASISAVQIQQILEHSNSAAIFIGKLDDYENQKKGIPSTVKKVNIDFYGTNDSTLISDWLVKEKPLEKIYKWNPFELMTIMYTSGTTGTPKGVMFHSAAFEQVSKMMDNYFQRVQQLPPHPALFSYLPLCHIAERNLTEVLGCNTGASISFTESLQSFANDVSSVQPHLFFGVPRIWAKSQEKILERFSQKALDVILNIPLLNVVVKKIIKKKLGLSRSKINISGAAPIPLFLLKWFKKLNITIHEIYGLTENAALSHGNQEEIRYGTVGKVMPSVQAKFSDEKEILVRHSALMMGYYKEPTLTQEIFTPDGFLKTGDIGSLDSDGFLTITGRVKDVFKTDKGKYVSPTPIEMNLLKNNFIDQVCVVGMGIPQPIALVVLSELGKTKPKEEIISSFSTSIKEVNKTIEDYEHVKKVIIMKNEWSIANGLMTPSLKIKRNEVEKIHQDKYKAWYTMDDVVIWE